MPVARRTAVVSLLATVLAITAALVLLLRLDGAPSSRPDLQQTLDRLVTGPRRLAPGAVAYVHGPKGTWIGAAGVADLKTREAVRPDARMRLESVGKIWTAALTLRLVDQGRLALGDTVEHRLPGALPYGNRITVQQLLTMTSGLIDNNDIVHDPAPYLARVKDPALHATLLRLARHFNSNPRLQFSPTVWIEIAALTPLLFPPGTGEHYSNIGYELLGLIDVRATGQSLRTLFQRQIFEPLGLTRSAYDPQGPIGGPHARGYAMRSGGPVDYTDHHAGVGAEGGIVSSAGDTARFLVALMHGELLRPATLERMKGDALWNGGEGTACGAGYGWSGAGIAYKTDALVSGDGERVAVLLLNGRGGPASDDAAGAAMRALYCAA